MFLGINLSFEKSISWLAVASSLLIYASGSKTCFQIIKRKTTGEVALVPFIASLYNGVVMLKYALMLHIMQLIIVCSINTICQICYITIYYVYSQNKRKCHRLLGIALPILYCILLYSKYFAQSDDDAVSMLGFLGAAFGILMTASPLVSLSQVIKAKSTKSLDFGFILANFIACLLWTMVGFMLKDLVVIAPNVFGIVLTVFQLSLFVYYPSTGNHHVVTIEKDKLSDLDITIEAES